MSTSQYLLNAGLLAFVLLTNLGTRPVTRRRLVLPMLIVVGVGGAFLGSVPTEGNDIALIAVLVGAGALLGVVAGLLVRVMRTPDGTLVTRAGWGYALLWIAVIGGRVAFAYGADHWFTTEIARFSRDHRITGAPAWTAAFVLMALAMVVTRVVVTAVRTAASHRTPALAPAAA